MCQRLSFYIQPAGYLNQWSPDFYDYSAQRIPQRPDRSSPFCNNPSYDVPEVDGFFASNVSCLDYYVADVLTIESISFSAATFTRGWPLVSGVPDMTRYENNFVANVENITVRFMFSISSSFLEVQPAISVFNSRGEVDFEVEAGGIVSMTIADYLRLSGASLDELTAYWNIPRRVTGVVILARINCANHADWQLANPTVTCSMRVLFAPSNNKKEREQ